MPWARAKRSASLGSCHGWRGQCVNGKDIPALPGPLLLLSWWQCSTMPNLFPATYLPHGNYKHILAQQASTHKVSPPGLLQIPRLCWSCLAPAIKDWVGRGDIYGGWPKRLALNLHLFQVLALNQLPAPEYLDCFLHATPSPWHPSSTNYLCQLYNTSCSPFDQRVCAVNAIKEQAKPPMQTPPKTVFSCFCCIHHHTGPCMPCECSTSPRFRSFSSNSQNH